MGDEDGGAAFHDVAEAGEDALFGVGIDRGQGVVEDEDAWVADDGSGDGGALFLSAGEGDSAFTDHGVKAAGEFEDFGGDVGDGGGLLDLLGGGVGCTEGDVVTDGIGEEEGLLGHEADVAAEGLEGEGADGAVVDEDGAGDGVLKAGDEVNEGGFAGAGGAYDGEAAAGGDAEVDVVKDDRTVGVGEGQVAKFDFACDGVCRGGGWKYRDLSTSLHFGRDDVRRGRFCRDDDWRLDERGIVGDGRLLC